MDDNSGPRVSSQLIAKWAHGQPSLPLWSIPSSTKIIEDIVAPTDRAANYVHLGWSLSEISTTSPWTSARITRDNQAVQDGLWITKRTAFRRLAVRISRKDIVPVLEFVEEVEVAVGAGTDFERFERLSQVFDKWQVFSCIS